MKEAGELINQVLLVGITVLGDNEECIDQIQVFGSIIRVDATDVVIKRNSPRVSLRYLRTLKVSLKLSLVIIDCGQLVRLFLIRIISLVGRVHSANSGDLERYSLERFSGYE